MTRDIFADDDPVSAVPTTPRRGMDSGWWLVAGAVLVPAGLAGLAVFCAARLGYEIGRRAVSR